MLSVDTSFLQWFNKTYGDSMDKMFPSQHVYPVSATQMFTVVRRAVDMYDVPCQH